MSKIVCGEVEIPCPYCTDGFVTAGDRHARTRQDVCGHCGGTARAPAGTGKTAATSAPPLPEGYRPGDPYPGLEDPRTVLREFRDFVIKNAAVWQQGSNHHNPIWQRVAAAIESPPLPKPVNASGLAELPKPLTIEILMRLAYDVGHAAGTVVNMTGCGTYFDRRNGEVESLIADVKKAGHMPEIATWPSTREVELTKALAALTDAFLNRHGCFPLDRTNAGEAAWNDAMLEAYRLVGQPNTPAREAVMARVGGDMPDPEPLPRARFAPADRVRKCKGDYHWDGVVVAAFNLPDGGPVRYVVAHPVQKGHVLHIYSDAQLEAE